MNRTYLHKVHTIHIWTYTFIYKVTCKNKNNGYHAASASYGESVIAMSNNAIKTR